MAAEITLQEALKTLLVDADLTCVLTFATYLSKDGIFCYCMDRESRREDGSVTGRSKVDELERMSAP
jgi:hypothetical protein